MAAVLIALAARTTAQTTTASETDKTAIRQAALDYIEGSYEADAERMERALHPDLAKQPGAWVGAPLLCENRASLVSPPLFSDNLAVIIVNSIEKTTRFTRYNAGFLLDLGFDDESL